MKIPVLLTFCMMIVTGILSVHALFRDGLKPDKALHEKIAVLEREKREIEFQARLEQSRFSDYQQSVATVLPGALKGKTTESAAYPLRQLASVELESDPLLIERASSAMEQAKKTFLAKDFGTAAKEFEKIISIYPDSAYLPEAFFLKAECQYQLKDFEGAIASIDQMVDLYPDNELTGYSLLRLGSVFEAQERLEDAGDVYRAVLANFKQPEIAKQANASLKAVAL